MQVFSRSTDAGDITDAEGTTFAPAADGSYDVPGPLAEQLLRIHLNGEPQWETGGQRNDRLAAEDLRRRSDPASTFDLLSERLAAGAGGLTAEQLRAAEDMRVKIKAEQEAEAADDRLKAAQQVAVTPEPVVVVPEPLAEAVAPVEPPVEVPVAPEVAAEPDATPVTPEEAVDVPNAIIENPDGTVVGSDEQIGTLTPDAAPEPPADVPSASPLPTE